MSFHHAANIVSVRLATCALALSIALLFGAACAGPSSDQSTIAVQSAETQAAPRPSPAIRAATGQPTALPSPTAAATTAVPPAPSETVGTTTDSEPTRETLPVPAEPEVPGPAGPIPVSGYRVIQTYPHDPGAWVQGLVLEDGVLYEGTGQRGSSSLRKVDLETGRVLQMSGLPDELFGEGVTVMDERIFQLTWKSGIGMVYDRESFELLELFEYPTQGWGITHDGEQLIMSDGTETLHFIDPDSLQETGHVRVMAGGAPLGRLNELEYVDGQVFANVWLTDLIARINPETGRVAGWIDLSGLLNREQTDRPVDVLNGIAFDPASGHLLVTGKLWPTLFEIALEPAE